MRIVFKACLAALASAALVGGMTLPARAGPHGGGMGGFGGGSFAAARGGRPELRGRTRRRPEWWRRTGRGGLGSLAP